MKQARAPRSITLFLMVALVAPPSLISCVTAQTVAIRTTEPTAEIAVDGGPLGTGFVEYRATSGSHEVSATHPDYSPVKWTLSPVPDPLYGATHTGLVAMGSLGIASGAIATMVGGILVIITSGKTTTKADADSARTLRSGATTALTFGIPLLASGVGLVVAVAKATTYPKMVTLDLGPYSLYDSAGYHKTTGLDHWGIDRDGRFPDGSVFTGRIVHGSKTGSGTWRDPEGAFAYEGNFVDDKLSGVVAVSRLPGTFVNQPVYFGPFRDGMKEGIGLSFDQSGKPAALQTWTAGELKSEIAYPAASPLAQLRSYYFIGGLKNGLADGEGVAFTASLNSLLSGSFSAGRLVSGLWRREGGALEQGSFQGGVLVQGRSRDAEGTLREGRWVNGDLQSPATITWADKTRYTGEVVRGVPDGQGSLTYPSGDTYAGHFSGGLPDGEGLYQFVSGTRYQGDFVQGVFEGNGKLVKANGESFEGPFRAGLPHGSGIYKDKTFERAEYYEGRRIDQAYLIREEREKDRIEKARQEELAEQRRIAAEEAQREAQAQEEAAQREKQANRDALALLGGLATVVAGNSLGLSQSESIGLGVSLAKDLSSGNGAANTLATAQAITKQREAAQRSSSGTFLETPQSAMATSRSAKLPRAVTAEQYAAMTPDQRVAYQKQMLSLAQGTSQVTRKDPPYDERLIGYTKLLQGDDLQISSQFDNAATLFVKYIGEYYEPKASDQTVTQLYRNYYQAATFAISVWENIHNARWPADKQPLKPRS